jgi:hypothetical protein
VWAWLSIIVVSVLILSLFFIPAPPQHDRGSVLVLVRSAEEAEPGVAAPPGAWLVVRRIPRPES